MDELSATARRLRSAVSDALGDDVELCELLEPWAESIREQKGHPGSAGQSMRSR